MMKISARCPICGSELKDSFTETYYPNEGKHNKRLRFKFLKNAFNLGVIFTESDPPGPLHPQRAAFEQYKEIYGEIIHGYSIELDSYAYIIDMERAINEGYIEIIKESA